MFKYKNIITLDFTNNHIFLRLMKTSKIYLFALLLAFVATFTSCKKEDTEPDLLNPTARVFNFAEINGFFLKSYTEVKGIVRENTQREYKQGSTDILLFLAKSQDGVNYRIELQTTGANVQKITIVTDAKTNPADQHGLMPFLYNGFKSIYGEATNFYFIDYTFIKEFQSYNEMTAFVNQTGYEGNYYHSRWDLTDKRISVSYIDNAAYASIQLN